MRSRQRQPWASSLSLLPSVSSSWFPPIYLLWYANREEKREERGGERTEEQKSVGVGDKERRSLLFTYFHRDTSIKTTLRRPRWHSASPLAPSSSSKVSLPLWSPL